MVKTQIQIQLQLKLSVHYNDLFELIFELKIISVLTNKKYY